MRIAGTTSRAEWRGSDHQAERERGGGTSGREVTPASTGVSAWVRLSMAKRRKHQSKRNYDQDNP